MTAHALHTRRLTVLRAAALFDGVSSALLAEPSVVVADGAITAVHGPAEPVPGGASVIDLPGLTLLPGLARGPDRACHRPVLRRPGSGAAEMSTGSEYLPRCRPGPVREKFRA